MIMSDMPAPENLEVQLVPDVRDAAGRPLYLGPTRHRYSHTEERTIAPDDVAFVHVYRCAVTGATRDYGCEGPNSPHITNDDQEEN